MGQPESVSTSSATNSLAGGGEVGARLHALFPGDSEMACRMRAFDWSTSDLGPTEHWPEHWRIAVRLCLTSRFPILLWWGPKLSLLYNDAYLSWLTAAKHPRALGRPGYECWSEVWNVSGPMIEGVLSTGQATWSVDTELFFDRKVYKEEVYITWTYAPILAADGRTVDGIFNPCFETTEKVIGARRLETLRKLALRTEEGRTVDAACKKAAAVLNENTRDIPFAAIYVTNETGDEAKRCATMLPEGEHLLPLWVSAAEDHARSTWPLASVLLTKRAAVCADLDARGVRLPSGPWPEATRQALLLPIHAAQDQLVGLLVVGVSSRRPLDVAYRTFLDLVAGHIGTAISDAKAYEAERKRAEALAEIDRAKTAFFSNVSHEFRTPLTLMLGPIEDMLGRADGSFTASREELDLVYRNGLRMLKLVNTLLDFSRIEAGRREASYEPTDLAALSAELASVFRSAIERAGLRLSVDCPPLAEPVYVDRSMWEKSVLNLMSNAFKFTFAGEIALSLRQVAQTVELSVSDTGTGIPAHEVPRLFERFHRVEGARGRTHEGSGIGLALVQELAKLHGGSVRAESVHDQGSRFTVSIPLGRAHLPTKYVSSKPKQSPGTNKARVYVEEALRWLPAEESAELKGLSFEFDAEILGSQDSALASDRAAQPRVLLADDNADMRHYVQRLLAESYEVHTASDGEAALAIARENPPDLVLTDIMMPRLDGFGLLQALRSDPRTRSIPVILLSARAGEESRVEGLEAGANDYLIKPFSAQELRARVRNLVMVKRARDVLQQELATQNEDLSQLTQQLAASRQSLLAVKDELAAELAAMTHLHELSTRLLASTEFQPLLEEVLSATIALQNADFGNVQLYHPETQTLEIVAQRGFQADFLDYFSSVRADSAACGRALQRQERVIIEDVQTDPGFVPHRQIAAAAGFRAVQSTPLFSRSGELLGMISTHFREPHRPSEIELRLTDLYARQAAEVVERKQTEERLRQSQEQALHQFMEIEAIYRTAPVGLGFIGPTLRFVRVNQLLAEMNDLSPRAHVGRPLRAVMPGLADALESICERVMQTGASMLGLEIHGAANAHPGEKRSWRISCHPVQGKNRKIIGVNIIIYDITESKRTEQSLRESEERFRSLVDGVKDCAIFMLDPDGRVITWNDGAERIKGYRAQEILGQHFSRFYEQDDIQRGKPAQALMVAAATGRCEDEGWRMRKDGSRFWANGIITVLEDETGKLKGFAKLTRDMTERKQAEEALRDMQAELAHAARVMTMGQLTASIAHEINQPLTAVITNANACAHLLAGEAPDLAEVREAVGDIAAAGTRASEVIVRIRALVQKTATEKMWLDLNEVIQDILGLTRSELNASQVSVQTELLTGLPPVLGDRVQLQQVLLNLIMNGIEAMTTVTTWPRMLLIRSQVHDSHSVVVAVQDSGVGLNPQDMDRLFSTFFTTKSGGMGMGLAISRSIIEAHGGRLWAAAHPGPGATFHFTLPTSPEGMP